MGAVENLIGFHLCHECMRRAQVQFAMGTLQRDRILLLCDKCSGNVVAVLREHDLLPPSGVTP